MGDQEYISDVIIENFQCHKETYLELVPGVNSLVGDTESGKSAVFKALEWFFKNEPSGDEYRSHWGGDTQVAICLHPSETWAGRVRSSTKNYYWVDEDVEKNRLHGFGKGTPPQQILDLFNIGDVNFQAQMTLPFLLSMTKGKVGKFFNNAADLDIINRSINNVVSMVREEKSKLKNQKVNLKELNEKIDRYNWLNDAEEDLNIVVGIDDKISELDNYIGELDKLAESIDRMDKDIKNTAPLLDSGDDLSNLLILDKHIDKNKITKQRLELLFDSINSIQKDIDCESGILKYGDKIENLLKIDDKIKNQIRIRDNLSDLIFQIKENDQIIRIKEDDLKKQEKEFHKLMPDQCPLCERG